MSSTVHAGKSSDQYLRQRIVYIGVVYLWACVTSLSHLSLFQLNTTLSDYLVLGIHILHLSSVLLVFFLLFYQQLENRKTESLQSSIRL